MIYAIDIETIPNEEAICLLPEVKAKANLKDEKKIKEDIEAKRQIQIEKMALCPEFGKIACIGIYGEDKKEVLVGEEKEILQKFLFEFLPNINLAQIVTYNGKGFDFNFIIKRALYYRLVRIWELKVWCDKYNATNMHVDLMSEYCRYGEYKSLDLLSAVYLGEKKIEFDVKEIPELMKTEEGIKKLKEYCLKDCELTYKLAKKFGYE
ncbi:MAG: hypothetical protein BV457_00040 [Thermoplasmata archaeon M9B1D]|nr:MAG: hypothetical protein BV457_00040 [Thermoplasmata archaeon M9B1D]PNX52246.1 MAG: hypothetical protein BV456_00255 [Thermoplasmata archaeon M8B2D]